MRAMRGVGSVAAGLVTVVLVSGCGSDGGGDEGAQASSSPTVSVSPTPVVVPTVEEPAFPATPEGDIDRIADEKGWVVDELYDRPSEFVKDICESLPVSGAGGVSRPQWLAEAEYFGGPGGEVLKVGIPKLCPKWTWALNEAVSGDYERWFGSGTYLVSSKAPSAEQVAEDEDVQTIPPGTYRAKGAMEDCYWERTSESGEIIDNSFATSAQVITVTIRSSDGQFTSEGCEVWKPVK